ncbi:MAG: MMPL family transporter [Bacteroidales bacterium]|nr:MMPL family transporter [Bacteroidales bacterium]
MHRIFLPLYHFFQRHKALMWILLIASTLFFAWVGIHLRFEEDIMKLLPRSANSEEVDFSDVELVDKIFIQVTSRDTLNPVAPAVLGDAVEEFCSILEARDTSTHYISGILSSVKAETGANLLDYGLRHIPSFIDPAWYPAIEAKCSPDSIAAQMVENFRLIEEDETGDDSQLVSMDPLNLRSILFNDLSLSMGSVNMENGHFFCPDKSVAIAYVATSFDATNSGKSTRLVRLIEKTRKEYEEAHPELSVYVHGNPMGSVSNAGTIKRDLVWTVGLSLLIILAIMLLSFHNFNFIIQQIIPVVYGAFFSMACMYLIKGYMSLMALGMGAIVLGVAISYCLHVLIHFYYVGDAEKMLRDESTPVLLGCITTVGAFLGLLFTESDLLRDFGLFATFALLGNTFFVLVFLPHFLKPWHIKFKRTHGFPLVERVNSLPWDRNKWFIGILLVIIVVGIVFSPRVKFDSNLMHLDYDDERLTASQDLYNRTNAAGYAHMNFGAWDNESLDGAIENCKQLFPILDSLQEVGLVKAYSPITRYLLQSTADQEERIRLWNSFWNGDRVRTLRKDLRASAREHNLPESLFDPFLTLLTTHYEPGNLFEPEDGIEVVPPGLMSNYVEKEKNGRYMVFTDVSYEKKDQETVWSMLGTLPHVIVLEPFFYCRDLVQVVHDDFSTTLWISSVFVFIVLLLCFRNLWISLLAFFPMFVSWYVMQGLMALFGLEFNLINIVISTFVYGIGVDYSIFVMEGLLADARRGDKTILSYHKVAIVYSALVLGIVTFSLVFAVHPAIRSIGLITLIGMATTILITYSLQPLLFRQLMKVPYFRKSFKVE